MANPLSRVDYVQFMQVSRSSFLCTYTYTNLYLLHGAFCDKIDPHSYSSD